MVMPLMQLAQLALSNPQAAAQMAAASGMTVPDVGGLVAAPPPGPVDVGPLGPIGAPPAPVGGQTGAPPTNLPGPQTPPITGPGGLLSGIQLGQLSGVPTGPMPGTPGIQSGRPQASQIQSIMQALGAGQQQGVPSLGQLIAGGR